MTGSAVLPISIRDSRVRPRFPMTIKSQLLARLWMVLAFACLSHRAPALRSGLSAVIMGARWVGDGAAGNGPSSKKIVSSLADGLMCFCSATNPSLRTR
jgi:hypothetical protein